ncbi:MAG: hypothetical protein ACOCVF_02245 [bacterium]
MKKIREHIEFEYNKADDEYWKLYSRLEKKKKDLRILTDEIENLESNIMKLDSERDKYQEMLNELNEKN